MFDRDLFLKNVNKTESCWEWIGVISMTGYGKVCINYKHLLAHRVSYEIYKGPITEGLVVRHICHNRNCVNPEHLVTGTAQDNSNDMREAGRQSKGDSVHTCKLTEAQVLEINASNLSNRVLAKQYNVSHTAISNIKLKKSWKHLHGK